MLAATAAPASTHGQLVVQLLLALGIGAILNTIAQALLSRRREASDLKKNDADTRKADADTEGAQATAAQVLTGSALSLLQPMREQLDRLTIEARAQAAAIAGQDTAIADLQQKVEEGQQRERGHVRQLTAYRVWAEKASTMLSDAGIPIDPPPHDPTAFPPLPPSRGPAT